MTASPFGYRTSMNNRHCLINRSQIDDSSILKSSGVSPLKAQNSLRKPIDRASTSSENRDDCLDFDTNGNNMEIFRTMSYMEDQSSDDVSNNDLWTLKRANPIGGESDDEEEEYGSPSKRTCMNWQDRIGDIDSIVFRPLER